MRNLILTSLLALPMAFSGVLHAAPPSTSGVQVTPDVAQRRVDITIDGKPFTSYIWPTTQKKAVLFPLITSDGITVTRGFPLAPRPGERVDHPHHAGLWFNYGNVNGFDFWNNSDAIPEARRSRMGTVHDVKIVSSTSGHESGDLVTEATWTTGEGQDVLQQTTRYVFSKGPHGERIVDTIVTLHALQRAVFNDDKEGLLGMRVAHFLESPTEKGGIFNDASGHPTKTADAAPGATGVYLTSEGAKGDAVWSTRGRWCTLTGETDGKTVAIAIIDHPGNPGYPTYWHARGYGLFAANPLGRSIFDKKEKPFNFTIEQGKDATFRYRVLLLDRATTPEQMNHAADAFAAMYKAH
ncbi:MAG: DUF6807 domain-containing protein [Acidobacteriaceae bacterium]